jgi:adenosine deaminase
MLPVAELHLHIEGTLEPELLVRLAARNGVALPTLDTEELRARCRFGNLQGFLDLYYANLQVLKHQEDFYDLARAYLTRAAAAGVRRAEIFFDPQTHVSNGVPLAAVFGGLSAALADAERDHGISADLILCFLRDRQTALTVCPLSNVALRVVDTMTDHMLPAMLDAGLLACVNSDDPAYFGGYVDDNLAAVRSAFGFDDATLALLARNSFDACFAPAEAKSRWRAEVDAWLAASASAPNPAST